MRTIEYRDVQDKSKWKRGPWDSEPDKVQWLDETTGLPCLIVRGPVGSLCGYIGVSSSHPFFGKDYDDVSADAHGGLTFAGGCMKDGQEASRSLPSSRSGRTGQRLVVRLRLRTQRRSLPRDERVRQLLWQK